MKNVVNHDEIGTIEYEESFWTGKKNIVINGQQLAKADKKTFVYNDGEKNVPVMATGNMLFGAKILMDKKTINVVPAPKWYEIVCSVIIMLFVMIWGNSAALCAIFPIVGGAIGGIICALFAMTNLIVMKSTKKVLLKLVVFAAMFAANLLACWLVAMAILSLAV